MLELLRDTRRYADYLRLTQERWEAQLRAADWEARVRLGDAYELAAQEQMCFVAELESRLPACVVDRIDRIAYRSVYGGAS